MTGKDMELGKYYHVQEDKFWMIGLVIRMTHGRGHQTDHFTQAKLISSQEEYSRDCSWSTERRTVREATSSEICHLDACIKAGRYLEAPKDEIVNDFQVF